MSTDVNGRGAAVMSAVRVKSSRYPSGKRCSARTPSCERVSLCFIWLYVRLYILVRETQKTNRKPDDSVDEFAIDRWRVDDNNIIIILRHSGLAFRSVHRVRGGRSPGKALFGFHGRFGSPIDTYVVRTCLKITFEITSRASVESFSREDDFEM